MPARPTTRSSGKTSRSPRKAVRTTTRPKAAARSGGPGRRAAGAKGKAEGTGLTWGEKGSAEAVPMRSVTPNLVPTDCAAALDWYAAVFGAKEMARMPGPGGRIMHAMTQVGDTVLMLSDNFGPPTQPEAPACAFLHIHDKGIQRMWDRAVANGATVTMPLANQFWGDRYGQLRDPFGITWSLGWPAKLSDAEKKRLEREAMAQMTAQVGA